MTERQVLVRRGRHFGWWVEGRKASGGLFIKTWWPTEGLARAIAGLVGWGNRAERSRRRLDAIGLHMTHRQDSFYAVFRGPSEPEYGLLVGVVCLPRWMF